MQQFSLFHIIILTMCEHLSSFFTPKIKERKFSRELSSEWDFCLSRSVIQLYHSLSLFAMRNFFFVSLSHPKNVIVLFLNSLSFHILSFSFFSSLIGVSVICSINFVLMMEENINMLCLSHFFLGIVYRK